MLLLAETGFVIRNLLLGTFADAILARRPLVVAVPDPADARLLAALHGKAIRLVAFPRGVETVPAGGLAKLSRWHTYMYRFKEAEKATQSVRMQTRLYEERHSWAGSALTRTLVATGRVLKRARLLGPVEDRYLRAVAAWPVTEEWRALLRRERPAAVVSSTLTLCTNRRPSLDLPPVVAARELGLPVGTLVQSWDNLSSKTAVLPPWLDRYWTWSETMSEELLDLNPRVRPERVRVVGSPQFDFHRRPELVEPRQTYLPGLGLDPRRPYVLYGAVTAKLQPCEPDTVVRLARRLRAEMPDVQLLVRLHPKDDGARWEPVRGDLALLGVMFQHAAPPVHMDLGGFVPPRDFYRDQVSTLAHAAVVLNIASTLTVDAAIMDRPVVCLGYDSVADPAWPEGRAWALSRSTHFGRLVATGGVALAETEDECLAMIRAYLADPALHAEGRRSIVASVTEAVDGGAGHRLAEEVLAVADAPATSEHSRGRKGR